MTEARGDLRELPTRRATFAKGSKQLIEHLNQAVDDLGIDAIAVTVVHNNGQVSHAHVAGDNFYPILGALECIKADIIRGAQGEE